MAHRSSMCFLVSFILGAPLALGFRRTIASQLLAVDNTTSSEGIIIGSRVPFTGSAGRGGGMGQGDMSVINLQSAFKSHFKPAMQRCAETADAQIIFQDYAGNGLRALTVNPDSLEDVDYWDNWSNREKFIGGGLNGCGQRTNNGFVCHVMMKLTLRGDVVDPESGELGYEEFFVVGTLSMGNMIFSQYGSQWKHMSRFSLVAGDKLQLAADGGYELVKGADSRQLLDWSCVEPDEEEVAASTRAVQDELEAPIQLVAEAEHYEAVELEAIENGAASRCCCVQRGEEVLAVAVGLPFAVGHWGNRNLTKGDHACPVIAMSTDTSEVCGCTTKNLGFTFEAESKCLQESDWTFQNKGFVGEPSHSPSKMPSPSSQLVCLTACSEHKYVATVTSACQD